MKFRVAAALLLTAVIGAMYVVLTGQDEDISRHPQPDYRINVP